MRESGIHPISKETAQTKANKRKWALIVCTHGVPQRGNCLIEDTSDAFWSNKENLGPCTTTRRRCIPPPWASCNEMGRILATLPPPPTPKPPETSITKCVLGTQKAILYVLLCALGCLDLGNRRERALGSNMLLSLYPRLPYSLGCIRLPKSVYLGSLLEGQIPGPHPRLLNHMPPLPWFGLGKSEVGPRNPHLLLEYTVTLTQIVHRPPGTG